MEKDEIKQWYEKIILYELSRPRILNKKIMPGIKFIDITNPVFMEDFLKKIKAISIYLSEEDYSKFKSYKRLEMRGGDYYKYYNENDEEVFPSIEAKEEFQKYLRNKNLKFDKGFEYAFNGKKFIKKVKKINEFWLKEKPNLECLIEMGSLPYTSEISLFVKHNYSPIVDHWID